MAKESSLFRTLALGAVTAPNRLAFAPCTRHRSRIDGVPTDLNVEYYRQRASAGLLITEGTAPSAMGVGYLFTPGLYTEAHIRGWRKVTDAVHAEGGRIFCQLMHTGRLSDSLLLPEGATPIAPSAVQPDPTARHYTVNCPRPKREVPYPVPRAMTRADIQKTVDEYAHATRCALDAGFDGVELHAASGYLPMQFLSTNTNLRNDEYGGSVANRCRFVVECLEAMAAVNGPRFVAAKVSPGWTFHNVMDDDPQATYSHLAKEIAGKGYAYLQVGNYGMDWDVYGTMRQHFDGPIIAVGGFTRNTAVQMIDSGLADMVAFGQAYIANPDLAERFQDGSPINRPRVDTYYSQGAAGYTDYPRLQDANLEECMSPDEYPAPLTASQDDRVDL